MRYILLTVAVALGCSSAPQTVSEDYPPNDQVPVEDAGVEPVCHQTRWNFGDKRYCEQCTCPGLPCEHLPLGATEPQLGVCDDAGKCSVECTDPLWLELVDAGTVP